MVTIWQEEQHISLAVGSIPATPREMGVLHGCHTVKFDSRNNLWSCVHTLTFSCAALLWVWINTGKIIIIALLWQISKHGTLKTVLSWYNCFVDALKYPIDKFALVKHCCYIYILYRYGLFILCPGNGARVSCLLHDDDDDDSQMRQKCW